MESEDGDYTPQTKRKTAKQKNKEFLRLKMAEIQESRAESIDDEEDL